MDDFPVMTTKKFYVTISFNGSAPDISNDTVTLVIKSNKSTADASAEINKDADVTTEGSSGKAWFTLSISDTDITPGSYYYEIMWLLSSGSKYRLDYGKVNAMERYTSL